MGSVGRGCSEDVGYGEGLGLGLEVEGWGLGCGLGCGLGGAGKGIANRCKRRKGGSLFIPCARVRRKGGRRTPKIDHADDIPLALPSKP